MFPNHVDPEPPFDADHLDRVLDSVKGRVWRRRLSVVLPAVFMLGIGAVLVAAPANGPQQVVVGDGAEGTEPAADLGVANAPSTEGDGSYVSTPLAPVAATPTPTPEPETAAPEPEVPAYSVELRFDAPAEESGSVAADEPDPPVTEADAPSAEPEPEAGATSPETSPDLTDSPVSAPSPPAPAPVLAAPETGDVAVEQAPSNDSAPLDPAPPEDPADPSSTPNASDAESSPTDSSPTDSSPTNSSSPDAVQAEVESEPTLDDETAAAADPVGADEPAPETDKDPSDVDLAAESAPIGSDGDQQISADPAESGETPSDPSLEAGDSPENAPEPDPSPVPDTIDESELTPSAPASLSLVAFPTPVDGVVAISVRAVDPDGPMLDPCRTTIDWGDGSGPELADGVDPASECLADCSTEIVAASPVDITMSFSHVFAESGQVVATVTAIDACGDAATPLVLSLAV